MEDTLKIGLIVKPQGIRGELKVQPLTDDINRYKGLKEVLIDDKTYRVTNTVISGDMVFLSLFGVSDRNAAETFRGKFLRVKRENAIPLEEGRYYIVDIVGCEIKTDDGQDVGKVLEITSARTDIFTVKCQDGRVLRFPFLKDLVLSVDIDNKLITVSGKRLLEVSCYED
ncbi:MAG: 16S rRNA processing protein RimM [Clostridiales bacterium]|nr:16S rRNA processing protein RimM [Clostridiales bacterium]